MSNAPVLIILGGLPGVGKTTIAKELARQIGAVHVRIDSIEQGLRNSGRFTGAMDDSGYRVAYSVAEETLRCGRSVIADCVIRYNLRETHGARLRSAAVLSGSRSKSHVLIWWSIAAGSSSVAVTFPVFSFRRGERFWPADTMFGTASTWSLTLPTVQRVKLCIKFLKPFTTGQQL